MPCSVFLVITTALFVLKLERMKRGRIEKPIEMFSKATIANESRVKSIVYNINFLDGLMIFCL